MAEDSRDPSSLSKAGSNTQIPNDLADSQKPKYNPSQSQTGKLWDAFGNPEEPVNALAKATYKPRGKDPKDVSYSEIIGTFPVSEMTTLHKRPCARESLLTGIGVGFGVGGLRGVLKGISTFFLVFVYQNHGANVCMQDGTIYGLLETGLLACLRSVH